jgi:hypothetical protein
MRNPLFGFLALLCVAMPVFAQTTPAVDEIIARYVKTVGGMDRIAAAKTLRRTGKYTGGGGFEADVVQENKRPLLVREEFTLQGMTAVNAYDGKAGWKIDPFGGKKDAEALSEEEMHGILVDADFDEPLINYKEKGNTAALIGVDQFEGTDVYKVKVTLRNGDTRVYFMDTDSYVPIKIEEKRIIRGSEQDLETTLGEYKRVDGWYQPFSIETGRKGQDKGKITFAKIEANVPIDDARFARPPQPAAPNRSDPPPAPKPIPNEER